MIAIEHFVAVFIVLALVIGASAIIRKGSLRPFGLIHGRGTREKALHVMDRLNVSPHHSLILVRWRGRDLLLGMSSAGWTLLKDEPHRENSE